MRSLAGVVLALLVVTAGASEPPLPGANGARATELADCLASLDPRLGATCHPAVAQAHATIVAGAVPGDRVLVLGSFLTVGAMMGLLERQGPA